MNLAPAHTFPDAQEAFQRIDAEVACLGDTVGRIVGDALKHSPVSLAFAPPKSLRDAASATHIITVGPDECPAADIIDPALARWPATHHRGRITPLLPAAALASLDGLAVLTSLPEAYAPLVVGSQWHGRHHSSGLPPDDAPSPLSSGQTALPLPSR